MAWAYLGRLVGDRSGRLGAVVRSQFKTAEREHRRARSGARALGGVEVARAGRGSVQGLTLAPGILARISPRSVLRIADRKAG